MSTQTYLDPGDARTVGIWTPSRPLPPTVREFGRFPNVEDWLTGDLILLSSTEPSQATRAVVAWQRDGGFDPEHASWHRAAIYLGAQVGLCEITKNGLERTLIYPYIGSYRVRIRRDASLGAETSWEIVSAALMYGRNAPYRPSRGVGKLMPRREPEAIRIARLGAELYADAYALASSNSIIGAQDVQISPALLSATNILSDVSVSWLHIGSSD